jgi:hypothetical protein
LFFDRAKRSSCCRDLVPIELTLKLWILGAITAAQNNLESPSVTLDMRPMLVRSFVGRSIVPHLAVVALTVIPILLILIFVRSIFAKRFAKIVYLALDALIVVFLFALILICFLFSTR